MANAAVEKLKSFGLHHGEKLVVGLAATLLVAFVGIAVSKPTIELQPDQLLKAAESAQANINQQQKPEDILTKLEEAGLKNPGFLEMVENQAKNALKPEDYKVRTDWATPEPGAGLIRDQPELVAPTDLAAFPGRGGLLLFATDEKGEKIVDEEASKKMVMNFGEAGMPGGAAADAKAKAEMERQRAEAEKRLRRSLVGIGKVDKAKEKEEQAKIDALAVAPQQIYKEETKGQRWVTITAVIDNAKLRENFSTALKMPPMTAYPNYYEVDLERQQQLPDGEWTEWKAVDRNANYKVLDNITEVDEELVPDDRRFEALVDPLPFLRAGYWTGVHVAKLVPAEAREIPKANPNMMGMGMGMGMSGMEGAGMQGMGMQGMGMQGMGMEGGMMMGGMGPGDDMNFVKSEQPELMIRKLDFSVEPDTTYRFRARILVVNPNKNHTDVNPGVDTESDHLAGPWSEPSDEVTVPADVAAYAQTPVSTDRRNDIVQFQVVKWDSNTGQTVVRNDDVTPGELVGEQASTLVPSSDGKGASNSLIDFNARAIMFDAIGGKQSLPVIAGLERNPFVVPAVALMVRPDGSVTVRSQARDKADDVRRDMENNYRQAIKDSTKKREPNMMDGMMPAP
ncbi:hypothetical protein TA3x_004622 [Tundrisphaera sp. TA3]|uniref:hypothetical protein n=1 Tax=Tundrisphaera sp. TA3 TaxID=3435775 RepID=UPI003EBF5F8E